MDTEMTLLRITLDVWVADETAAQLRSGEGPLNVLEVLKDADPLIEVVEID